MALFKQGISLTLPDNLFNFDGYKLNKTVNLGKSEASLVKRSHLIRFKGRELWEQKTENGR